jgi:FAD/FMN-containing dehydrogenase
LRPTGYAARDLTGAAIESLSDIASSEERLDCYSRLYSSRARVFVPSNLDELRRIFACAKDEGHRVTVRGAGHCFDAQSLGDDLVVSMSRFDSIEVLADEEKVRVGAGARWGEVFAKVEPHGLIPAITVTTERATAGGTLSGDCLSRFSPALSRTRIGGACSRRTARARRRRRATPSWPEQASAPLALA